MGTHQHTHFAAASQTLIGHIVISETVIRIASKEQKSRPKAAALLFLSPLI
jgi:hypothetical protein